ncbi:MAG: HEAT repeat domain-containing protein [Bacteroidia bacterium]
MAFYDLPKSERDALIASMHQVLVHEMERGEITQTVSYFDDADTYIRKTAYQLIGRIYFLHRNLRLKVIQLLNNLLQHESFRVRQTVINAAGEIGKYDFELVKHFFDQGLFDAHHSPRNAVIGSIKKMGEVNPNPILAWAKLYLHHENKEIRREICHGIELRGRKYPQDILPMLKELQHDKTARVRNTLVHVLGQIAYKKGCLETVVADLKHWENQELVKDALDEIVDVHERYKNFSVKTQAEAIAYIDEHFGEEKA